MQRCVTPVCAARARCAPCREATADEVAAVHDPQLVRTLQAECDAARAAGAAGQPRLLTPDTYVNEHTLTCARLAAGGAVDAAVAVATGRARAAAAIVRPPGAWVQNGSYPMAQTKRTAVCWSRQQMAGCLSYAHRCHIHIAWNTSPQPGVVYVIMSRMLFNSLQRARPVAFRACVQCC
jgi:hypothetical protein